MLNDCPASLDFARHGIRFTVPPQLGEVFIVISFTPEATAKSPVPAALMSLLVRPTSKVPKSRTDLSQPQMAGW